jgi:LacI family transcriptional regulator
MTIYDVAKRAEVSVATVSAVLNRSKYVSPELTQRVKQAAAELDYSINLLARSMQTGRTHSIGMLIPLFSTPDPFYAQVIHGVEDVLRRRGYTLNLGQTYNKLEEQSRYISGFRARSMDGLLIFQAPGDDPELRKFRQKKPVVFVGRIPEAPDADVVAIDIVAGTRIGMNHLIARGHRRIGLVVVKNSLSVRSSRIEGWRQALKSAGLPLLENYICEGDLETETDRRAATALLSLEEPPTAVFVDNLLLLIGVFEVLRERGIPCPRQMEIMSSDDAEWLDVFDPQISTVVQPSYELGVKAAEVLLKRLRYPNRKPERLLLRPTLRIRSNSEPSRDTP